MSLKEATHFYPESREAWRQWLQEHHRTRQSVWLICYRKKTQVPTVSWSDAVDEALCFGWIDSTRVTLDEERFRQFFTRRKPTSTWSRINKEKIARLSEAGLMTPAGDASVDTAKKNGSWNILDDVEDLKIPGDLMTAFKSRPGSKAYFTGLSKSARKIMLYWLVAAKRPETRQKRIDELADMAAQQQKPKQFR